MTREAEAAIYRLLRAPGLSAEAVRQVLAAWAAAPEREAGFWGRSADEYRREWSLPPRAVRYLAQSGNEERKAAEAEAAAARAGEIEMLSVLEPDYAALAAERRLSPVIFTRGNQDLLWGGGVAILHSRGAPEEALAWGAELAGRLAKAGVGLATGHNRDAYRRTAAAAKRAGAPVVIVLDRPLHGTPAAGPRAEPVVTARVWDAQFRPERELLVSPLAPREAWGPAHARLRDETVVAAAGVTVAGAVRPGGILEAVCRRALEAGRPLFRSPCCQAAFPCPALPAECGAAATVVAAAAREAGATRDPSSGAGQDRRYGWAEKRWAVEAAEFVAALETLLGAAGRVERGPAGPLPEPGTRPAEAPETEVAAAVLLPGSAGVNAAEMVVVRRSGQGSQLGEGGRVLVLTPGEAITELAGLRAYLSQCRARVQAALRTPPP